MIFEVEKKFWLDSHQQAIERLRAHHVDLQQAKEQVDRYFAHPARDFIKTDEVLRLRRSGDNNYITYKGARIDSTTKTRRELELPLLDGAYAEDFQELLIILGFQPLMTIHKMRSKGLMTWNDYEVEVCLDEIDQLGNFIELETTSDLEHLDRAKEALESLAENLGLDRLERRSYLELLVSQLGPNPFHNQHPPQ